MREYEKQNHGEKKLSQRGHQRSVDADVIHWKQWIVGRPGRTMKSNQIEDTTPPRRRPGTRIRYETFFEESFR